MNDIFQVDYLKSRAHINRAELREGEEIYQHPEGYFILARGNIETRVIFMKVAGAKCTQELKAGFGKTRKCVQFQMTQDT